MGPTGAKLSSDTVSRNCGAPLDDLHCAHTELRTAFNITHLVLPLVLPDAFYHSMSSHIQGGPIQKDKTLII